MDHALISPLLVFSLRVIVNDEKNMEFRETQIEVLAFLCEIFYPWARHLFSLNLVFFI